MIYSNSLDEMVLSGFYMKKKDGTYRHYTWNDEDCVYWADDVDDRCRCEVPTAAVLEIN